MVVWVSREVGPLDGEDGLSALGRVQPATVALGAVDDDSSLVWVFLCAVAVEMLSLLPLVLQGEDDRIIW